MTTPEKRLEEMEAVIAELHRLERKLDTRIDGLEQKVDSINGSVADVMLELGGVPHGKYREKDRPTLRTRMHAVEDRLSLYTEIADRLVAEIHEEHDARIELSETVDMFKQERLKLEAISDAHAKRWSRRRIVFVTVCAGIGGLGAFVGMIVGILNSFGAT